MATATKPLGSLAASDLMSRGVITIPYDTSLRKAAHLLFHNQISGAPVVDAEGRVIGVLSAIDFVHWAEKGGEGAEDNPLPACPYQVKGRLLTGEDAVICVLAEGSCPLQAIRPSTGGRHIAVCLQPNGVLTDWQQVTHNFPASPVQRYMTTDVVTAGPQTRLSELAQTMIDAHIHRVIVVDEQGRPLGIVSSTDLLAVLAHAESPVSALEEEVK